MNNQDMNNPHSWLEVEINLDKSYALYFNKLNSNKFFFPLEIYFLQYHYGKCSSNSRIFYPVNTIPEILLKKM